MRSRSSGKIKRESDKYQNKKATETSYKEKNISDIKNTVNEKENLRMEEKGKKEISKEIQTNDSKKTHHNKIRR